MPTAHVNGVDLAYEEYGEGYPLIWIHEFAGSMESWLPQVNFFSRRYRVIVYNARGYPPSEVPADIAAYSQDNAVEDLYGLLQHLGILQAHVGGLGSGAIVAFIFTRTRSLRQRWLQIVLLVAVGVVLLALLLIPPLFYF